VIFFLTSCKPPIVAPEDIDSLLSYMYAEMAADNQEALLAGTNNLFSIVDSNRVGLEEGFAVSALSEKAVETTGESTDFIDDSYGVSLLKGVPFAVEDIAWCYSSVNLVDVYDQYISYERELLSDLDCFLDKTCSSLRYRSIILGSLPLNVELTTVNIVEMQWLETERGTALLQRAWMEGEAEASADWADLQAQNYLEFSWNTDSGSEILAASWAALQLGDAPLPEDTAKNLALNGLEENAESLSNYLAENPAP
jgi:hypothetical protein